MRVTLIDWCVILATSTGFWAINVMVLSVQICPHLFGLIFGSLIVLGDKMAQAMRDNMFGSKPN
jgi:hypothetical protein